MSADPLLTIWKNARLSRRSIKKWLIPVDSFVCDKSHPLAGFWMKLYLKLHVHLSCIDIQIFCANHDDVIKWKHFPRNWPFVRGTHRSPVNSPHKGQWRGALMFSLNCARINDWVNNGEAGDLRRNRVHYDVIVMYWHDVMVLLSQSDTW